MLEVESPCLITVLASACKARYMSVPGIVKAYDFEVETWGADKIDVEEHRLGLKGSPTKVKEIENVVFQAKESKRLSPDDFDIESLMRELIANHTIG